jgi:hypothetical protein
MKIAKAIPDEADRALVEGGNMAEDLLGLAWTPVMIGAGPVPRPPDAGGRRRAAAAWPRSLLAKVYWVHGRHEVATALRTADGGVYTGVHLEGSCRRSSICAEGVALGAARGGLPADAPLAVVERGVGADQAGRTVPDHRAVRRVPGTDQRLQPGRDRLADRPVPTCRCPPWTCCRRRRGELVSPRGTPSSGGRNLTWADDLAAAGGDAVIIPVGAIEQHGPHLPLAVDTIICEAVAERRLGRDRRAGDPAAELTASPPRTATSPAPSRCARRR